MKKTILVIFAAGTLGLLVAGFAGCASAANKSSLPKEETFLEPQAASKFSDIPVPSNFKFLSQESYSFESGGVRVAVLKYQGKADVDQVVNFYKDQMPLFNWNLLNAVEYGQRLLNFDREQQSCIVNLTNKGKSVSLVISVGPKSEFKPRKSEKPVK
ncbi:MAG: hypothetical protein PHE18_08285 [Candidatus Omnitrophica bacterium]|nr:hypothetical protein [Candidatus Omnitrophota bacterium]MDD5553849.1 hypothetical protein [Candidatus Omnitrophota bacterium]